MAAAGHISSEFDRLRDASWLATGYMLGLCAVQPMVSVSARVARIGTKWIKYGKLSDVFGRKPLLLVSYFLFGVGCIIR